MHQGKPVLPVTQQSPPEMLLLGNKRTAGVFAEAVVGEGLQTLPPFGPLRFVLSPRHKSGWCLNFEMGFESPTSRMERLDGLTPKCPALKRIFESYAIFGALKRSSPT